MIFDIKLSENFRQKARFVAGGHTTDTPSTLTYSSVVAQDSVCIALIIAALNDLDLQACDIQNAYLTTKCQEKIWCVAGKEFGEEEGSILIVEQALYGLKASGAAFRAIPSETITDAGFRACKGDPDVYIWPATKADGFEYYEMILCYVDDIMCVSHRAKETLREVVEAQFKLKGDSVEPPEMYLGAQLSRQTVTGQECWTLTSNKYVTRCDTPIANKYRPELDESPELDPSDATLYQEPVGELRWVVELG